MVKTAPEHTWTQFGLILKYALKGEKNKISKLVTKELQNTAKRDPQYSSLFASIYSLLGEKEKALDWYGKIMEDCQSCRRTLDPYVKKKYADISFDLKQYSTDILEIYLSLAQEDPANRRHHFMKVSELYSLMGNETESGRFRAFAQELQG